MKKSLHLLVLTLYLFLFSCKKDKNAGISASIVGKWNVTSSVITFYGLDGNVADIDSTSDPTISMTFFADGTIFAATRYAHTESAKYALSTVNGKKKLK